MLDTNCSHLRATVYFAESLWKKSKAQESEFTELEYGTTLEDIKDLGVSQLLQLADDISHTTKTDDVKGSDITYFLFTSKDVAPIIIDEKTKGTIDSNKPTKLIIHGWIATNRRSWNKRMAVALLKRRDFIIDSNVPLENIHLIGHSLGAHVAGFAAKKIKELTGEKIGRISGLEPAGPIFRENILVKQERLDQEDANVVDVIHTDAAYCSNGISIAYFIEWINGGKFHCRLCKIQKDLLVQGCNKTVVFGEEDVDEELTGSQHSGLKIGPPYIGFY
ncbi:hypothetical protein NQ317_019652 [Molorchus minor]|uniref:Lipase domain-containing protein n=1 Tax=Molorchus minor TaxID=1323400 RepID=A0ABQ9IVS5_9CUCU|nr:hypothetical protein NQ317_019652 [Molorchus minor]